MLGTKDRTCLLITAVTVLLLTALACGESVSTGGTGKGGDVEEPTQTTEASPTVALTSEAVVTIESTVEISGCVLAATFEADITTPDNTRVEAGRAFIKTWRIRNTGTCEWGSGYQWTFIDGEQMGGPDSISVPQVAPGESVEISVDLVAPAQEGQYRGRWQMCVNETECFGDTMYVQIMSVAPTPTALPIGESAYVDCVDCAQRGSPWLLDFRSEPGSSAGTVIGGVRHCDEVTILEREWHQGEAKWWYLVRGWDEYTNEVGDEITGWIPGDRVTIGVPEAYSLGPAWVECEVCLDLGAEPDIPIWDRPYYYDDPHPSIGSIEHGTRVEILGREWDSERGIWFYEITGPDYETGRTITGWLDGIFLVLAPP